MNDFWRALILVAMIVYLVAPIDGAPGPIDDVIILLIGAAARKSLAQRDGP